jgi:hypothetical protein
MIHAKRLEMQGSCYFVLFVMFGAMNQRNQSNRNNQSNQAIDAGVNTPCNTGF